MARFMFQVGLALRESGQALDRLGCMLQGNTAFKEALNRHRMMGLFEKTPALPVKGFVAPSASVIGDVALGEKSSVWYGCVLRGDVHSIKVGASTNIQDNTIIHVAKHNVGNKAMPTTIGDRVTVGHAACLHACTIDDDAFIGMGATVMDGAVVEKGAMVAAGAVVTPGTVVKGGQIWGGTPAKFLRAMTPEESAFISTSASNYAELAAKHALECAKSLQQVAAEVQNLEDKQERSIDYDEHVGIEPGSTMKVAA